MTSIRAGSETSPSPPPSYGSAASHLEAAYLFNTRRLNRVRSGLTFVILACAAAVTGCAAHAVSKYNGTHLSNQWWLPLWPQHFDLRPTIGILACGAIITFLSLVFLAIAVLPSVSSAPSLANVVQADDDLQPHGRTTLHNALATITSVLGFTAAIFGVVYSAHLQNTSSTYGTRRDTIPTWTCRWSKGVSAAEIAAISGTQQAAGVMAPAGFSRLCTESHAAFDILALLICFEAAAVGLAGVGWVLERKVRAARREGDKEEMF